MPKRKANSKASSLTATKKAKIEPSVHCCHGISGQNVAAGASDDLYNLVPLFEAGEAWLPLLKPVIEKNPLAAQIVGPKRDKSVVPVRELTFQALKPHPPGEWNVIIFGQNPYPRVESATGIAMFDNTFSSWDDKRLVTLSSAGLTGK